MGLGCYGRHIPALKFDDSRDEWAARKACWSTVQLTQVVQTTSAILAKATKPSCPSPLVLVHLQRVNRAFLTCRCVEDSRAMARRLHAAHPTALAVMVRVVVEGDSLSFVAVQSMLHWSYCDDACKTMVAMGAIETLTSMLSMASACFKNCAVDLLGRLVERDRSGVARLLRPRLLRALLQLVQDDSTTPSKRTIGEVLGLLEAVVAHPKASVQLKATLEKVYTALDALLQRPQLDEEHKATICRMKHRVDCMQSSYAGAAAIPDEGERRRDDVSVA